MITAKVDADTSAHIDVMPDPRGVRLERSRGLRRKEINLIGRLIQERREPLLES
jgi:hypothetical protein